MYQPGFGLISSVMTSLHLPAVNWLGDQRIAMYSVVLLTIWWTVGFNFVLYLAGLQEIPRHLYEAAAIDGAGPWQQIRRIMIPMLGRTTTLVAVLQVIASLKVFDQIYLLLDGGPNNVTRSAIQYIYQVGFYSFRTGYAAAASFVLFLLILVVSVVWFSLVRTQEKGV
jgi:multiple sugar transport system permease protein